MLGYTSGGSPIHFGGPTNKRWDKVGKALYGCSVNPQHRLTLGQAKSSSFMCSHCGAELKCRKQKVAELESAANVLGFILQPKI